jgi:dihydroorotate dehydrogenase (NAD+) catalytic subunit
VTKTVTPLPRGGNAPVRIAETEHGMLNSIGLANPGIEAFLSDHLPRLTDLGIPLWISVGGFDAEDYAAICDLLDDRDEIAVVELNLSCPNVEEAPESSAEIVSRCRSRIWKPLYAKLSPALPDVAAAAVAVKEAGADGLSLVNTIRGLALDEQTLAPRLGPIVGGYSGPALRPIALAAVHACYRATGLPIVGMGGVTSGRDALELIAAGATHVALGTVLFSDPDAPGRVRAELADAAASLAFEDPAHAHAVAHRKSVAPSGNAIESWAAAP